MLYHYLIDTGQPIFHFLIGLAQTLHQSLLSVQAVQHHEKEYNIVHMILTLHVYKLLKKNL